MGERQLELTINAQEFFRERVSAVVAKQRVDLSDHIEFYVVNLLCEFIAPNKLSTSTGELDAFDTPLAIMVKEALEAPPAHRARIYKYLGDSSLYMAGFFQDYFNRKAFDLNYYISLGSSAYTNVASLMRERHGEEHFSCIYEDLADKFGDLVEVVAEVSETPGSAKPIDILAVYDRWTRKNSDRLLRMLRDVGITPIQTPFRERQ
ncbi:MAG: hypothetical protein FJ146_04730 [Deltaproteobacteria bacterium]|nr:hypothetical protein [Deltaproteobacteria bacterium]